MDGNRLSEAELEIQVWKNAHDVCAGKVTVLEQILRDHPRLDLSLLEILIERERDICAQLHAKTLATAARLRSDD